MLVFFLQLQFFSCLQKKKKEKKSLDKMKLILKSVEWMNGMNEMNEAAFSEEVEGSFAGFFLVLYSLGIMSVKLVG